MFATWNLPEGDAADKKANLASRMKHYRFQQKHYLNDGTRVVPTIKAMKYILQAADDFGLKVAISKDSYDLHRSIK